MLRSLTVAACLSTTATFAQSDASFDAANNYATEESHTRACDAFIAFLKTNPGSPLRREAEAKQARSCIRAGRSGEFASKLQTLANQGEKDFARAYALFALGEQGYGDAFSKALPLLKQAAGDSRIGKEARALFVRAAFTEIERNAYDTQKISTLVEQVLDVSDRPADKARARLWRGRSKLGNEKTFNEGERELRELGNGGSELADDALYTLGQAYENRQKFVEALATYDEVVKRFSATTSSVRNSAQSQAQNIRQPAAAMNISYIELPGTKPQVSFSYRNIDSVQWTLRQVNPMAMDPDGAINNTDEALAKTATRTEKQWTTELKVSAKHAPGSTQFELDVPGAGVWLLSYATNGLIGNGMALVTPHATVLKAERDQAITFTADAMTGKALGNANVVLYVRSHDNKPYERLTAKADATGVARFDLTGKNAYALKAWAEGGGSYSYATGYIGSWSSEQREHLAYVQTDRPLYKPGETVGFKVYVRSREDGPSVPVPQSPFTLYVRDPSGKEIARPALTTNSLGTATFNLTLPANAQLGSYSMYVQSNSLSLQQFSPAFRVEEYKPPEYTVSIAPVGKPAMGEKLKFKVSASFFFGGPVANASGRALVQVKQWTHRFGPWPDQPVEEETGSPYPFFYGKRRGHYEGDGSYRYQPQFATHTLTFKTGADGTAEVEVPALTQNLAPAVQGLEYALQVFVTDASRREVSGTGSVKVSSTPFFVDLRADRFLYKPGERVEVTLSAEDANGKPESPPLHLRLVRVNKDGMSAIAAQKVTLLNGRGVVKLDADALGPARIEVRGSEKDDAPVLAQSDIWLTQDAKPMLPEGYGFQVFVDKAPLKVGDSIRALVVSPSAGGHALVSIENEHVTFVKAVEMNGRGRFLEVPLTGAMAPNAWLQVYRFEQASLYQQSVDIRVKGSEVEVPVKLAWPRASTEPGSSIPLTVEAPSLPRSTELDVAVTVVDEALYAMEPEKKDFLSFFGRKQRDLRVQTSSTMNERSYRRPLPHAENQPGTDKGNRREESKQERAMANSAASPMVAADSEAAPAKKAKSTLGSLAKERSRDEADDANEARAASIAVRSDFGSSSGWFPSLSGKGALSQKVKLKDSLTSWKATAYVITNGPQLGVGSATVRTEKPLMVRLQAPRFFTERDEVTLSAIVTSRLNKNSDVEVAISAPGLKALGPANKTLKVEAGKEARFDVRFHVVDIGEPVVRATVRGGGSADAMEWKLPSIIHGSAQRQSFAGRLSDNFSLELELPEKRNPRATRFELTLSPSLISVMFDALPYLAQYPYGCVEQTLSRFVPAAIARRAVNDLRLPASRVPDKLDDMIGAGLQRLYGFQHSDGGWGWWQTDPTNLWMSAYVVYGLGLGLETGLPVDKGVLERGRSFLVNSLGTARNQPETQAFMTYALASTGTVPKSALDFAFEQRTKLSPRGRALVALALLSSKDKRARIAVENLDDVVKKASARNDAAVGDANNAWSTSAAIEATAYTLMAMLRYDVNSPNIKPLTDFLVLRRNGGQWRNTRDTAFAVYALSDLARKEEASTRSGSFVVRVNGREVKRVAYSKGGLDLTGPVVLDDSAFRSGKNVVEVRRDGLGTGYYAALFDVFNQNDFIKGVGGDLLVTRKYTLLGKPSTQPGAAPTEYGMPLESGERVRVDLEIKANKAVEFVMLEDLKPAGLEAVQTKSGPQVCNYACAHAELRTDRVAMFLQQIPVGVTKLSYELRAEVPGTFSALPARSEAMYAPELRATSDEMRFEVKDAPDGNVVNR
ncbi:MAG: hypothetical protein K1X64_06510 [Myxococcaceae bacterium]|nr:hypothetical protein [Myxococcaceae bacterium]